MGSPHGIRRGDLGHHCVRVDWSTTAASPIPVRQPMVVSSNMCDLGMGIGSPDRN